MNNTPLEEDECITLVEWMKHKNLLFTHTAQSTFTRSWTQKSKNKRMGVNPGLPDYIIIIPQERSETGKSEVVYIEMKRKKGGVVSKAQKEWIKALADAGQYVYVCEGAGEAIEVLESLLSI